MNYWLDVVVIGVILVVLTQWFINKMLVDSNDMVRK
jgi:hypothetical protein